MRGRRALAALAVVGAATLGQQAVRADGGAPIAAAVDGTGALSPTPQSWAVQHLLDTLSGVPVEVARDARGVAHSVGAAAGHLVPLPAGADHSGPQAMARAHLERLAPMFALRHPTAELEAEARPAGLPTGPTEDLIVRFRQLRSGLPVIGADLTVVMDPLGALRSVTAATTPLAGVTTPPVVTAEKARATALALVTREHPRAAAGSLHADVPRRWFLDPVLVGLPAQWHLRPTAVWWVQVRDGAGIAEAVLVDSGTGAVPFHWSLIEPANRVVCDDKNVIDKPPATVTETNCQSGRYARTEGQAATGATEVDNAYDKGGVTANFYSKYLGVDLTALIGTNDGDGKRLRSTVRYCPGDGTCIGGLLSNAFWNGNGMYYGDGWTGAQDIVSHELTHGVTQNTSQLLYFYQSGAINESLSDVFGEIAQRTDPAEPNAVNDSWEIGEESPLNGLRSMSNPPAIPGLQADTMVSQLYDTDLTFADSGGVHQNSGVGNKAAYLIAQGETFNGQTVRGLGLAKTAKLYFRVEQILPSGAQYNELGNALRQACTDLTGQKASDGTAFTADDCKQVARTVTATAMYSQPTGSAAAVATPRADTCPSGRTRSTLMSDSFESFDKKRWQLGAVWVVIGNYATDGKHSVYGVEPDSGVGGSYSSSLTLLKPVTLTTHKNWLYYLRFAHQYRLDSGLLNGPYYDGVLVEYKVSGGTWHTLTGHHWQDGPNRKISPNGSSSGSYTGWGGNSAGYLTSKVDVSFLVGKKVQFRWRMTWDKQTAVDGWTIDDVRVYGCK